MVSAALVISTGPSTNSIRPYVSVYWSIPRRVLWLSTMSETRLAHGIACPSPSTMVSIHPSIHPSLYLSLVASCTFHQSIRYSIVDSLYIAATHLIVVLCAVEYWQGKRPTHRRSVHRATTYFGSFNPTITVPILSVTFTFSTASIRRPVGTTTLCRHNGNG